MLTSSYTLHPDDPHTALVKEAAMVAPLLARDDIHAVIWQRGLEKEYSRIFAEAAMKDNIRQLYNAYLDNKGRNYELFHKNGQIVRILGDGSGDDTAALKKAAPAPFWTDLQTAVQIMATIPRAPEQLHVLPLINEKMPNSNSRVRDKFHVHSGLTINTTLMGAPLEIMNVDASMIPQFNPPGGLRSLEEHEHPEGYKVYSPAPGDMNFIKYGCVHRRADAASEGRMGFALFFD